LQRKFRKTIRKNPFPQKKPRPGWGVELAKAVPAGVTGKPANAECAPVLSFCA
jgi:hypothetical protein